DRRRTAYGHTCSLSAVLRGSSAAHNARRHVGDVPNAHYIARGVHHRGSHACAVIHHVWFANLSCCTYKEFNWPGQCRRDGDKCRSSTLWLFVCCAYCLGNLVCIAPCGAQSTDAS